MNKRICLILLPVLAIILSCINCKADSAAFFNRAATGLSVSATYQNEHSGGLVSLEKRSGNTHKNAIRIKAWDDAAAIVPPSIWIPAANIFYYTSPFYFNYTSPTSPRHFSRHKLRGPPVV